MWYFLDAWIYERATWGAQASQWRKLDVRGPQRMDKESADFNEQWLRDYHPGATVRRFRWSGQTWEREV